MADCSQCGGEGYTDPHYMCLACAGTGLAKDRSPRAHQFNCPFHGGTHSAVCFQCIAESTRRPPRPPTAWEAARGCTAGGTEPLFAVDDEDYQAMRRAMGVHPRARIPPRSTRCSAHDAAEAARRDER